MSEMTSARPDAELLARIAHLRLHAVRTVDSMLAGQHRSPHRGASMTFVEHRDYVPGDDVRLLDWRAYARNDRYVIRRFEQESQQTAYVVLDASSSMSFASTTNEPRKVDYAATLLAAMAYVLLLQGDAVGAFLFDRTIVTSLPARQRPQHFEAVIELLSRRADGTRETSIAAAIDGVIEHTAHRRLIMLASDMLDMDERALSSLASLSSFGHDVILFHVLSSAELALPFEGAVRVHGLENEAPVDIDAGSLRRAYDDELQRWLSQCEQTCRDAGIRYVRASTDMAPELVLTQTFAGSRKRGWA